MHGKSNRQDHRKSNSCKIATIQFEPFSDNRLQRSIANNTALTRITVSCDSGIETKRGTMKLQQLIYAVKVAECGSITEASRKLFVSQPSITAAISDLEKEMDVRIFDRTNKGVTVSEEGETFLGYARQVLEQADLLESRYKDRSQQAPHFSISCQHYSFAVNAFVGSMHAPYPTRYGIRPLFCGAKAYGIGELASIGAASHGERTHLFACG